MFFTKRVKHTFYTLFTVVAEFGGCKKLMSYFTYTLYIALRFMYERENGIIIRIYYLIKLLDDFRYIIISISKGEASEREKYL